MARTKVTKRSTNKPRATSDHEAENLPIPADGQDDHLVVEVTEQDLPDNRTKKFMGQEVAEQRKFDDKAAERFLTFYAQTGRKADSAKAAGVTYHCVRYWEVNHEEFGQLVIEAHEEYLNMLERELMRRAVEGVLKPIVSGKNSEIITYERQYSDKLLELALRKADPTGYGNNSQQNVNVNVKTGVLVAPSGTSEENTELVIEDVEE